DRVLEALGVAELAQRQGCVLVPPFSAPHLEELPVASYGVTIRIDDEDGVPRRLERRLQQGDTGAQLVFDALAPGDVRRDSAHREGDPLGIVEWKLDGDVRADALRQLDRLLEF